MVCGRKWTCQSFLSQSNLVARKHTSHLEVFQIGGDEKFRCAPARFIGFVGLVEVVGFANLLA